MKRKLISIFCVLILTLTSAGLMAGCQSQDENVVRVNEVTHSIFYAPFYAAISLGYFEEEGITIDLTNGGGSDKSMTAVISGQADIGLMGPETGVYVCNEGREDHAIIIGQLTKRDGSFLLGKTKDDNFTWDKLKGTSIIGGRKGGMPQMTLEYVMKKNGVVPGVDANVRIDVQFDLMGGAFIGGEDDYVALFEPVASTMELAGEGYIVASIGEEGGEVPYTCFMATKEYLAENGDIAEAFMRAVYKGQQWVASSSPEEIAEAIADSFPDNDMELLVTVVRRYKEIDVWMSNSVMTEDSYDRLISIIKEAGIIEDGPEFTKLVDNSIAQKIIDEQA